VGEGLNQQIKMMVSLITQLIEKHSHQLRRDTAYGKASGLLLLSH
jgi:hypothetical protein